MSMSSNDRGHGCAVVITRVWRCTASVHEVFTFKDVPLKVNMTGVYSVVDNSNRDATSLGEFPHGFSVECLKRPLVFSDLVCSRIRCGGKQQHTSQCAAAGCAKYPVQAHPYVLSQVGAGIRTAWPRGLLLGDSRRHVTQRLPDLLVLDQVVGALAFALLLVLGAAGACVGSTCNAASVNRAGAASCSTATAVKTRPAFGASTRTDASSGSHQLAVALASHTCGTRSTPLTVGSCTRSTTPPPAPGGPPRRRELCLRLPRPAHPPWKPVQDLPTLAGLGTHEPLGRPCPTLHPG